MDFSILRELLKKYSFEEVNEKTKYANLSIGTFSDNTYYRYKQEFYNQK